MKNITKSSLKVGPTTVNSRNILWIRCVPQMSNINSSVMSCLNQLLKSLIFFCGITAQSYVWPRHFTIDKPNCMISCNSRYRFIPETSVTMNGFSELLANMKLAINKPNHRGQLLYCWYCNRFIIIFILPLYFSSFSRE